MPDREETISSFLASAGWGHARRKPLAGDASSRRYERLVDDARGMAVLMDAPDQDVIPFVDVAEHLIAQRYSAPRVLAQDPFAGLLLLEDLGDALFARVLQDQPDRENELYCIAVDLLVSLHKVPVPDSLEDIVPMLAEHVTLTHAWYPHQRDPSQVSDQVSRFRDTFSALLNECDLGDPVMVLRDFHAENLIWLPDREGLSRVGLLDFQDAVIGPRAYDLVSLMQDARRDVPKPLEEQMIRRYLQNSGVEEATFRKGYALLGLQRNLRIVGVFARLAQRDGKVRYVDMIPRVWGYVERALEAPWLAPLAQLVWEDFPEPTQDLLSKLRRS